MSTNDCVFCNIARDPVHPAPIYRDERVFALRDINPKAPVHLLIIPNLHLNSLAYIGPGQVPIMGHLFEVAEELARREGVTLSGFRLTMNQGQDPGQEIAHLHLHLLGGRQLGSMG
jgi:histidine triad (HIT) family protein